MFQTHVAVIISKFFDKTQTITRTIGAVKHVVNHFHKSVNVRNELENSTYDMFERLLEKCLAIYAVLHDQSITKPSEAWVLDLTDDQLTLLEAIVSHLYTCPLGLCVQ